MTLQDLQEFFEDMDTDDSGSISYQDGAAQPKFFLNDFNLERSRDTAAPRSFCAFGLPDLVDIGYVYYI